MNWIVLFVYLLLYVHEFESLLFKMNWDFIIKNKFPHTYVTGYLLLKVYILLKVVLQT